MKKIIIIAIFFVIVLNILIGCQQDDPVSSQELSSEEISKIIKEFELTLTYKEITEHILSEGCVRDKTTAISIASAIFKTVYGDDFNDYNLPLIAIEETIEQCWYVRTQLPDDINLEGGYKYIIIRKSNAEVIAIWATK